MGGMAALIRAGITPATIMTVAVAVAVAVAAAAVLFCAEHGVWECEM
jgi:hypothetical protein